MFGFVKVAAATPKLHLGDIQKNVARIVELYRRSEAAIIVFPEMSLTGYTIQDLFYQERVEKEVLLGLGQLCEASDERVMIVGAPLWFASKLYNCAVVIQDGKMLGVVPKSYLANYREFYEKRWFSSGKDIANETILDGIPFGTDLLFRSGDVVFGVEICEDLWSVIPPSSYQAASGANLIFNLSASDELVGKHDYRKGLVISQSARGVCGYIYASSGVGESSQDLLYGGARLIAENGALLAEGERFSFSSQLTQADIDIQKLHSLRRAETSFADSERRSFRTIPFSLKETEVERDFDPHPFVPSDPRARDARCEEIFAIQSSALARRVEHIGSPKLVLGVSGGLDSTLALLVCVESFRKLGRELKDIHAISMPGFGTTKGTKASAQELCEALGVHFEQIDIKRAVSLHLEDIGYKGEMCDVTFENAQARERTQILMDYANMVGGIVVGTGDLSELALGFCTYNGDQMSMYGVNAGVPKTLVRYLIAWVADKEESIRDILLQIINRPITPELLPTKGGKIVQKTEEIIGPYELHDFFLYHLVKYGASGKKILFMAKRAFSQKYDEETIKKWLALFLRRFFANQFKRDPMPDGVKVGTIALSPRGDWRMPSDMHATMWLEELS